MDKARAAGEVVLGVPATPHGRERLVLELISSLDRDEFELNIIPGVGRDGAATAAIGEMPSPEGLKVLMAPELVIDNIDTDLATVVLDIDSPLTASDVKLHLLRAYPPEHGVYICKNDEDGRLHHRKIALHEMDRLEEYDYTTCLYIPPVKLRDLEEFDFRDLVRVMDMLRALMGVPGTGSRPMKALGSTCWRRPMKYWRPWILRIPIRWLRSLRCPAQVVFHARIGSEHGEFDIRTSPPAYVEK